MHTLVKMKRILVLVLFVFACNAAFSQKFKEGHYYTHDGQRVDGLIRHHYQARFSAKPDNHIVFKENADAKQKKLTTKDVRAFVINNDSFIIVKDFVINGFAYYEEDFVKVVKTGKINLYLHHSTSPNQGGGYGTSPANTYMIEKNGALQRLNYKDFKDNFERLFGDNEPFLQKLKSKDLTYKDIEQIVEEYNATI